MSEDPVFTGDPNRQLLQNPQSLNSYSYAGDNPVRYSDPTGLVFGVDDAIAVMLLTGVVAAHGAMLYGAMTGNEVFIENGFELNNACLGVSSAVGQTNGFENPITGEQNKPLGVKSGKIEVNQFGVGGAYGEIKGKIEGMEAHHMPAASASQLNKNAGPAILMTKEDHMNTASWGRGSNARLYREKQSQLIREGSFKEAQQMDIKDIRSSFGNKYDPAIKQMMDYTNSMSTPSVKDKI